MNGTVNSGAEIFSLIVFFLLIILYKYILKLLYQK